MPAVGYIRIVDIGLQQEHKYWYDSRTSGSNAEFTLRTVDDNGDITTPSSTQLIDSSADFNSPQVEVGMLIRNTTMGKTTHVWEVTNVASGTTLDVRALYGPLDATQDWDNNDTFTINRLIGNHTGPSDYGNDDELFDLFLDLEVTGTSINNTFVKEPGDFGAVVQVRKGKDILPFAQNVTVSDSGVVVTVVRTADTIAT